MSTNSDLPMQTIEKYPDLEGLSLDALDAERTRLFGTRETLKQLEPEELERLIAINARMRLTARVASKPKASRVEKTQAALGDLLSKY